MSCEPNELNCLYKTWRPLCFDIAIFDAGLCFAGARLAAMFAVEINSNSNMEVIMNKSVVSTILFLTLGIVNSSNAFWSMQAARCQQEPATASGLEQTSARGRNEWAKKCFPQYRKHLKLRANGGLDMHVDGFPDDRPLYVLIGTMDEDGNITNVLNAPITADAPCLTNANVDIVGICVSGCYTLDQVVHFGKDGYLPIGSQAAKVAQESTVLSANSTPEKMLFRTIEKAGIVSDPVAKAQDILTIRTQSGGVLRVTTNHPVVDSNGYMREAHSFKVGESLVKADGTADKIKSIQKENLVVRVANVQLKSTDIDDQIVIGQGFLNGSLYFQSESLSKVNRLVLRRLGMLDRVLKF